jgi:peptidoglycan/xylan/chitin deacetylase (PgdA/CDA1 family)
VAKEQHRLMGMFSRAKISAWVRKALLGSAALRLSTALRAPSAAILMYHSVLPDPQSQADTLGDISHSQESFRAQMELLSRDYHPISLDDVIRKLRADEDLPRRSVIITFDDGYADNCEVAMPILNTLGIPATFYVIVDCIENRTLPWPARLRYALRKTTIDSLTDETGKTWKLFDANARDRYFALACETACRMDSKSRQEFLIRLQRTMRVDEPPEAGCLMMTLEQLQTLIRRGHVVGSHTMTHPNMAYVDANEA